MTVDHDGEKIETMEGKPNPNTEKLKKLMRQLSDTQPKMQPGSLAQRYRKHNNIVIYYQETNRNSLLSGTPRSCLWWPCTGLSLLRSCF